MDNTREKLIELVTAALCNQSVEEVADHLIANGVKIPVLCNDCDIHGKCSVEVLLGKAGFCSSGRRRTR